MRKSIFVVAAFCFLACNQKPVKTINPPLAVVVKLISAEEMGNLDEARKYQNVQSVYGKLAKEEGKDAEACWKEYVNFGLKLSGDKKFTNEMMYDGYDIEEAITGSKATVSFHTKKPNSTAIITYNLTMINNNWIVQEITYKK